MSRWRAALLLALVAGPALFLVGLGAYTLWENGWSFYAWFPMAGCLSLAYFLGWHWQRKQALVPLPDLVKAMHWTERDREAWKLVEKRSEDAKRLTEDQMIAVDTYLQTARELGIELARFYHPTAKDPVAKLTIPEILTVVELAAHDMVELANQYLPGGHMLTVDNWRQARKAADWYRSASNLYWAVAAAFSPVETAARYALSQFGMSRPLAMLQQNLILWFYTAYLQRVGTYLIELNSGRLRVGAERYRALVREGMKEIPTDVAPAVLEQSKSVTICIAGQVKAGKSSLVNALVGEVRARTDILPATDGITRYEVQAEGVDARLFVLDTVGYGHEGPKADQLKATMAAAKNSDIVFLAVQARNPARASDLLFLEAFRKWFDERQDLRPPPILAVMTHIDLLTPAIEWSPPYNLEKPMRPKEVQIQAAMKAVRDQLGKHIVGVAPVCVAPGKVFGLEEWLLPALVDLLQEARGVAILRCLRMERDADKVRRTLGQLAAAAKGAVQVMLSNPR